MTRRHRSGRDALPAARAGLPIGRRACGGDRRGGGTGLEVEAWTYRSHVDDYPERGRGYASATEDLRNAVQDGILRPGRGTRAVLLGYSHNTQFAHLLAFEHPQVPFAASVMLDSICLGWDADHAARLVEAFAPAGLEIVRLPGMHHQESDEAQGPSFDAWTGWVLEVRTER